MKQKTIATRHLRTKIAAGYVLILFVIFGIVYIWLNEQHRRQELEITSQKIRCLRKDIHEVYVKMVDLSLIGETVLDWNEEDMNIYHKKRLEVDSLLSLFKSSYRSERIDSVCRLLAEKENLLNKIMLVLNEQEEIKDKIARRVPVIARKSSQEEPPKRKRTGFLGLFGKKEEAKPTVTTSMLNTLNSDVIARQKEQSERLSQYTDSLSVRNRKLNCQLQGMIKKMDARIRTDLQQQETELAAIRRQSSVQVGGLTAVVALLLLLSYFIIHRNVKRICRYRKETSELIDKLQKTVQQNKQLLTARRKIMLTVTHELRTPLTAINGYGELLAQTEDENKRIEYTQNIRQAAGRMTDMLNSLLNFFRLDSGKEQANAVPFRLRNVAEILQTEFEPRAEAKDLTLRITGCSDIILMGDRNRLVQIGNNLLSNAIKFTESGTVGLDMAYEAGKLVLTVQDTGTGMSHEQKEKIFEPFERLPNAAVKDGFGLGLPIVKNTVTLLGGTVDVESEEGKGSRFTVKLPMPLADNIIEIEKRKAGISARRHAAFYSVLVLDNDEMTLAMTKEMYGSCNIRCDTCANTSDLMEAIRERHYDLLITDLRMPETNGYDVLKLLRSSNVGNSQTIPVIVTTAWGNCDEQSLLDFGFSGCLFKPFSLPDLLQISEKCIGIKEQEYSPDLSPLLAYGNKEEMLDTLTQATEKEMQGVKQAGMMKDLKALDEWVHHLRSSWSVIRADKPLWKLHGLLHKEGGSTEDEISRAVDAVVRMGQSIIEQAKKERRIQDEGFCG